MKKIIFLDIDGVLNSYRSVVAYDDYPKDNTTVLNFDMVAVGMIRTVCKKCNVGIVLSSTWRCDKNWDKLGNTLNLPIIDRTPQVLSGDRGHEINLWLKDNKVSKFVIVDDLDDFTESQQKNFVHVNPEEGLSYKNYQKILEILGEKNE